MDYDPAVDPCDPSFPDFVLTPYASPTGWPTIPYPDIPELPQSLMLEYEYKTLGLYFSGHPLDAYQSEVRRATRTCSDLATLPPGAVIDLGGRIVELAERRTKKGPKMAKFTFEDFTGTVAAIAFPRDWASVRASVGENWIGFIRGRLQFREAIPEVIASDFLAMADYQSRRRRQSGETA